jgi:REP element-mobilizing transposase RayT
MLRGIERGRIFLDDRDRADFLDRLTQILPESGMRCFAWALMPNHVHMAVQTGEVPLPRVMARLNTGYARAFNERHDRVGYLFENRYKSIPVDKEGYLVTLVRYIHLNPVRAGLVASVDALAGYRWTGHGPLLGTRHARFQDTASILDRFGKHASEARARLQEWMREPGVDEPEHTRHAGDPEAEWVGAEKLRGETPGSDGRAEKPREIALARAPESPGLDSIPGIRDLRRVLEEVCARYGVPVEEIGSPVRTRASSEARAVIAYIACRRLGLTGAMVARELGVSKSAVTQACVRGARLVSNQEGDRRTGPGHPRGARAPRREYLTT